MCVSSRCPGVIIMLSAGATRGESGFGEHVSGPHGRALPSLVSLLHVFHGGIHCFLLRIQMCISVWLFKLGSWVYGIWQEGSKVLGSNRHVLMDG